MRIKQERSSLKLLGTAFADNAAFLVALIAGSGKMSLILVIFKTGAYKSIVFCCVNPAIIASALFFKLQKDKNEEDPMNAAIHSFLLEHPAVANQLLVDEDGKLVRGLHMYTRAAFLQLSNFPCLIRSLFQHEAPAWRRVSLIEPGSLVVFGSILFILSSPKTPSSHWSFFAGII